MFSWAKQTLAHVAGTQEPIYGPEAVQSVAVEGKEKQYTEITREDMKWAAMDTPCVETQVFYASAENGPTAFVQVIYSNLSGIRTTCQFNIKVFHVQRGPDNKDNLWSSTPLTNHEFSEDMTSFFADDLAVELSEDGDTYTVKSLNDERAIVNLALKRTAPGFQAGKTGRSLFGTDLNEPWGSMRHFFWPRCVVSGTITTQEDGPISFDGHQGMFVHALQGMKPQHLASRWNFANYQGPEYSAVLMEFTTPPSYGSTTITVGGIARDGEIIVAGADNTATHLASKEDTENDWPEPTQIRYTWAGNAKDGSKVEAVLECPLEDRLDRIDVMAEVPMFVKKIAGSVAGTKPYIYQYYPRKSKLALKIKKGDEPEIDAAGQLFAEATFIS